MHATDMHLEILGSNNNVTVFMLIEHTKEIISSLNFM